MSASAGPGALPPPSLAPLWGTHLRWVLKSGLVSYLVLRLQMFYGTLCVSIRHTIDWNIVDGGGSSRAKIALEKMNNDTEQQQAESAAVKLLTL